MTVGSYFSATYAEARGKFRDAATRAGARLVRYDNPTSGPEGEALSTDVAILGPADARAVLVTVCGTHGAEGFCGSGVQVGWFESDLAAALPPGLAHVAVHAINPSGFAWLRRVTEENVDLNRNFVDHAGRLPVNAGYDELADAISPRDWTDAAQAAARARLDAYAQAHGAMALQQAISGGQYDHADGIFYGGTSVTWARRTLERIVADHLSHAHDIALIDYHTGLGPYGYGEPIVTHAGDSGAFARARDWYGETITSPFLGSSSSAVVTGDGLGGLERLLAGRNFTGMALEYGTKPVRDVLDAVRADNWLHQHGDLGSAQGAAIKRQVREAFYGDAQDWKTMIFEQAVERQRQALAGLSQ